MNAALIDLLARALPTAEPAVPADAASLDGALAEVRQGLAGARARAELLGLPVPECSGQLYRPLAVLAGARAAGVEPDQRLWLAALAVQMAHEASLLHDDVIDGAETRRGRPTTARAAGVARALIEGDHLLTAAYRLAAETGSPGFMRLFATSVERTVAGEKRQAAARGRTLDWAGYRHIVAGKSGELFGCALGAATALQESDPAGWVTLGRRVGSTYQMVDDLLDYCPAAPTGKEPLGDYRAGLWTWVRLEVPDLASGLDRETLTRVLFAPHSAGSPMRRLLDRLDGEMRDITGRLHALGDDSGVVGALLAAWHRRSVEAVRAEEQLLLREQATERVARLTGGRTFAGAADRDAYFAEHGRTFRFASRLFPADARARVAAVYAFCRFTDDLVDRQPDLPVEARHALLDAWRDTAWEAYRGRPSGIPLLDAAMGDMAGARVPFRYAAELIAGARMDLGTVSFDSTDELRLYTYRVASVVGLWLTELFGVRDHGVLERAAAMGHAMQLTNILRDVGEDLAAGRLYLPTALLATHGLSRATLEELRRSRDPVPVPYVALCEHLMQAAERHYAYAFEALPDLPGFFRRPVAVAARAYEGIHDAIRRNGYDNLRRRASTTLPQKLLLGAGGLRALQILRQRRALRSLPGVLPAS